MLTEITADLVTYLEGHVVAGGKLEGIKLVQAGDANAITSQHPCITVDWDDRVTIEPGGNHWKLQARFAVTLYTVSLQGQAQAEADNQDLLIRYDAAWKGLLPALAALRGYDGAGRNWMVSIDPAVQRVVIAGKEHRNWTLAAIVLVTFETMVNPTEF